MLLDHTGGKLMATLAWALAQDKKAEALLPTVGPEAGSPAPINATKLGQFVDKLVYLDTFATVCTKEGEHDKRPLAEGRDDAVVDPLNTVVKLTSDSCPHSFGIVWMKRLPKDKREVHCECRYGGDPAGKYCHCYVYFMNGGLIFHASDETWSVHT